MTDQLTHQQTDMRVHEEIELPILKVGNGLGNIYCSIRRPYAEN